VLHADMQHASLTAFLVENRRPLAARAAGQFRSRLELDDIPIVHDLLASHGLTVEDAGVIVGSCRL
jgi:hypothetical protein